MDKRRRFCIHDCKIGEEITSLGLAIIANNAEDVKRCLDQGDVKDFEGPNGESLLCFAFEHHCSNNVLQLLVDGGCLPSTCAFHDHELFCALDCPSVGLFDEDFFRLLIRGVEDINEGGIKQATCDRSPLCFALKKGAPASVIKLLLEEGCALSCAVHSIPLRCATSGFGIGRHPTGNSPDNYPRLKADVVQMLLHTGVDMQVLKGALVHGKNEVKAIELLLDSLKGEDLKAFKEIKSRRSLLHLAVSNPYVRLDVVKLLVKRVGIKVGNMTKKRDTILHEVMKNRFSGYKDHNDFFRYKDYNEKDIQLYSVVEFLLESGARVNVLNSFVKTPLHLGVCRLHRDDYNDLLSTEDPIFGITSYLLLDNFYASSCFSQPGLPKCYNLLEKGLKCCTMLLKHYLLEISDSVFQSWIQGQGDKETFERHGENWICELQKLDTKIVGQDRTLREYLGGLPSFQTAKSKMKAEGVAFNQLLRTMTENDFPLFVDVIASLLPRLAMEIKLQELQVYVFEGAEEIRLLSHIIVCNIGKYLTKQDLLRFILAFYRPNDQACAGKDSKLNLLKDNRLKSKHGNKRPLYKTNYQVNAGKKLKSE